jgi:hypothetical protein
MNRSEAARCANVEADPGDYQEKLTDNEDQIGTIKTDYWNYAGNFLGAGRRTRWQSSKA